jgi:hypothetical protein
MRAEIFPFSLGFNECHVIREKGVIMIDGGTPNRKRDFVKAMKNIPLEPESIKLVVIARALRVWVWGYSFIPTHLQALLSL